MEDYKGYGGFPPIFKCSKAELELIEQSKNREYVQPKQAIKLSDILKLRRQNIMPNNG